ncbi:Predicted amidohydrolase [Ekhidna lutea]|uniref:Omega-amidase YafV n=1 Tax=Ekhidna lutea TaxID=447679 RepID=A0A239FQR4_EKHLU|nr:amidohydrolase [Ekhidna lutea]SNS58552.1 Predicted amidohydrolase [Ekhidna lutea]
MKDLTISLFQADLHWEEIDANLAMFEEMIWSVDQTDLVVLPEMFTTGFSMSADKLAEPPGGKTFKWMRQMAIQRKLAITGSVITKEQGNFYNRLYFVYPDGSSKQYDKKHLFNLATEGDTYTAGTERLIIQYEGWRIHPMICYDLRFPVWARSKKSSTSIYEYDLLLYVANWPDTRVNAWDTLLEARAIENLSYCAGVNRVGTDGFPKDYNGHSGVYSPKGDQLVFSESKEEILTTTLSASDLKEYRENFPFQEDSDEFELK